MSVHTHRPRLPPDVVPGDRRTSEAQPHLHSVGSESYPDWEAVYLDNVERVYRVMFGRVGNRADAEDLTAEVFQAALQPLRMSASRGEVRAYLLATARTVLASHWRRHYAVEITTIDPERDHAEKEPLEISADAPKRVTAILAALPERYRRILELRFLEANSLRETARAMNVSLTNAKVLQHRALHRAAQLAEERR